MFLIFELEKLEGDLTENRLACWEVHSSKELQP